MTLMVVPWELLYQVIILMWPMKMSGLRIINNSNPATPYEEGYFDTPTWAWGVAVSGNYTYVADADAGLRIINISNPASPFEEGYYNTPVGAYGVAISGNYAYMADVRFRTPHHQH